MRVTPGSIEEAAIALVRLLLLSWAEPHGRMSLAAIVPYCHSAYCTHVDPDNQKRAQENAKGIPSSKESQQQEP